MHFSLTCYLRCEICIYNLLDSGSSRLIGSLLLVGVGTYMALQKMFDFMRWKAVKPQQFASLLERNTYICFSHQRSSLRASRATRRRYKLLKNRTRKLYGTTNVKQQRGPRSMQRDFASKRYCISHCSSLSALVYICVCNDAESHNGMVKYMVAVNKSARFRH